MEEDGCPRLDHAHTSVQHDGKMKTKILLVQNYSKIDVMPQLHKMSFHAHSTQFF